MMCNQYLSIWQKVTGPETLKLKLLSIILYDKLDVPCPGNTINKHL